MAQVSGLARKVAPPIDRRRWVGGVTEALVMAVALVTAMLNLFTAVLRLLEAELARSGQGRGGRHRR